LRRVFLNTHESEIAGALNTVVAENTNVAFGSYPVVDNPDYRVVITIESKSTDHLNRAFDMLLKRLSQHKIVRTE
jgi:molybdopterin-biosynthesis enzyme MoeA-like protein